MEIEKNFSLFGNIKNFLLSLIAGSIVFSILVPRIVNNLNGIFGIGFIASYLIFVFAYFVLPFLAVVIWFNSKRYRGFNLIIRIRPERYLKLNRFYIDLNAINISLFAFLGLIFTDWYIDYVFILCCPLLISYFIFQAVRLRLSNKFNFKQFTYLDYEFILLLAISLIAALVFTISEVKRNKDVLFKDSKYGDASYILKKHKVYTDLRYVISVEMPTIKDSLESLQNLSNLNKIAQQVKGNGKEEKKIDYAQKVSDSLYYSKIKKSVHSERRYLDKLYQVDTFLLNIKRVNSLNNSDDLVLKKNHFINLIKSDKPVSKSDTLTQLSNDNRLKFQKSIIGAFENYGLMIAKRWEGYMKENWKVLIQKLQFKGLLWFFTLYFLSICTLYFVSFRLEGLSALENKKRRAEMREENRGNALKSEAKLHKLWLIKQLHQDIETEVLNKVERLSITGSVLKGFILNLVIFIAPFFRHIESEDIKLEKPFIDYDLASATGIKALGPDGGTEENGSKPMGDSSIYVVINSFNSRVGIDSEAPGADTAIFMVNKDTIMIKDILEEVRWLNRKTDGIINKITDEDPDDTNFIIGKKQ